MCGIFGFARLDEQARALAPLLAMQMESRGSDSWGASDGVEFIKHSGAISKSWELPTGWSRGIFHTRTGTSGSKLSAENAHPHQIGHIIGIHNGIISNDTELNTKYGRTFEVDSIHIWAHLAEELSLEELNGYAACAWYDTRDTKNKLHLWRSNHDALHIAVLKNGNIVFASTDTSIVRAAQLAGVAIDFFYDIKEHTKYFIEEKDGKFQLFYEQGKLKLGSRFKYNPATDGNRSWMATRRAGHQNAWDDYYGSDDSNYGFASHRHFKPTRETPDYFTGPNSGPASPDESTTCVAHHRTFCNSKVLPGQGLCDKCVEKLAFKAAEDKDIPTGLSLAVETAALELSSGKTKQNNRTTKQNSATSSC